MFTLAATVPSMVWIPKPSSTSIRKTAVPQIYAEKFNLNFLFSEGLLQGKVGEKGYWYAAGRRSYIDLFIGSLSFGAGAITAFPRFWDYQLKAGYDFNEKHQLFFNLFASGDRFALKLDGENVDEDFQGNASFESGFEGGGIHLRSFLTERLTSYLSLTRSKFLFDINFGRALSLEIDAPDYVLREDIIYELNAKHRLESGVIFGFEPGRVTGTFSRILMKARLIMTSGSRKESPLTRPCVGNALKPICKTGTHCCHFYPSCSG